MARRLAAGGKVPQRLQLVELSHLPMLYNAWTTGNLPLWMIDSRDFSLLMAFDGGVNDTREKGYGADSFAVDPLDAFPDRAVKFSDRK